MMDAANAAGEVGDVATEDMIVGFIKHMEKRHWMFRVFLSKKHEPSLASQN